MLKRIITGFALIAAVAPILWFGGIPLYALIGLIILVGGFELLQLSPGYKWTNKLIYLILLIVCFALLFVPSRYMFTIFGTMLLIVFSLPIFQQQLTAQDSFMMSAIFVLFYAIASAFLEIYKTNDLLIWYIAIATYACDTGAFFAGYFFGKHKLCERLSPKKTIEGSIGGIVFSCLLSFGFAFWMLNEIPLLLIIVAGLTMPIVSQIGDLAFSSIKRNYGIKDFSNIFPGHGGFMDRIDSLVFNLVFFHMLMVVIL